MFVANGLPATVKHEEGSKIVQVVMPGVEVIELELSQPPANLFQIKAADYNFDGYKDFAFVSMNQASGIQAYDIFLYHEDAKTFEQLDVPDGVCESFGNVRLTPSTMTFKSSCRGGNAKSSVDTYRWSSPFNLELVSSKDNTMEAQQEAAAEKAEKKAEKTGARQEVREEAAEKRKVRREEKEDGDD